AALLVPNPVVVGLVALGATAWALRNLTRVTVELQEATAARLAQSDQVRAADMAQIARLRELASAGRLATTQQVEAQQIVEQLNKRYQGLNLTFDKTTGKLHGVAEAQERMTRAMREAALLELHSAIREVE